VLHLDDEIAESDADSANMFNHYFHSAFSDSTELSSIGNYLEPIDHIDSILITVEEVNDASYLSTLLKLQELTLFLKLVSHCTIFFQCPLNTHTFFQVRKDCTDF